MVWQNFDNELGVIYENLSWRAPLENVKELKRGGGMWGLGCSWKPVQNMFFTVLIWTKFLMWRKSPWLMQCEWEWSLSWNNRYVQFMFRVIIVLFCFFTLQMWESQVISSRICLERKSSFLTSNQVRLARVSCLIVGGILYIKWLSDRERCFIKDLSFFSFSFGSQLFCTNEFFFSVHHVPQCSLGA